MSFGAIFNPRSDPGRESVVVELWEVSYAGATISFACSPDRTSNPRTVAISPADIRRLERRRRAGDYWTRCFVTLPRHHAERLALQPYRPRVFVDSLFRFPSRDPQAYRVGLRHDHHWCHLFCEPGEDDADLHAIAQQIGMRRAWFQNHDVTFPHYDLVPPRRAAAIRAGAQEVELRAWLEARRAKTAAATVLQNQEGPCPTR